MSEFVDDIIETVQTDDQEASMERVRLHVGRGGKGKRVDKYIVGRFRKWSRTIIQRMIDEGAITVNDKKSKPSYVLKEGDVVDLTFPAPESADIVPEPIPLNILFEDDHIIALNKPANIVCHPARPSQTGTIANALAYHSRNLSNMGDPARPGIVHRLDKNTTGVLITAKTDEAHFRLGWQFEKRTMGKTYLAIVHKVVQLDEDVIDMPLAQHPVIKDKYLVPGTHYYGQVTKQAVTRYRVLERFDGYTLVELLPKTGRTHQLRVHMSYIGHPCVGDSAYGGKPISEHDITGTGSTDPFFTRQALHAWRLRFTHPISEEPMQVQAPLPDDFKHLLSMLRKHRHPKPTSWGMQYRQAGELPVEKV